MRVGDRFEVRNTKHLRRSGIGRKRRRKRDCFSMPAALADGKTGTVVGRVQWSGEVFWVRMCGQKKRWLLNGADMRPVSGER